MEQKPEKIVRLYDSVAKKWAKNFLGEHEKKPQDQEILHRFSQKIGEKNTIWDFGCGAGETSGYLKNLGLKISGLDLSGKMLEQARINHPGILFRMGNILELYFDSNSIDAVVAFYAIVHFTEEQVKRAFSEIFRVLQPGGLLLFTYHIGRDTICINEFLGEKVDIDFMFFSKDFICNSLMTAGFDEIEIIEREPYLDIEYQSRRAYVFAEKPDE